jgi:hypothetical protein
MKAMPVTAPHGGCPSIVEMPKTARVIDMSSRLERVIQQTLGADYAREKDLRRAC